MKITIQPLTGKSFEFDRNLSGVQTYDQPHSGKLVVKEIQSVTILSDSSLYICVTPVDAPVEAVEQPEPMKSADLVPAHAEVEEVF